MTEIGGLCLVRLSAKAVVLHATEGGSIPSRGTMKYQHGITGNLYVTSPTKEPIIKLCEEIGKSSNAVYWSTKYNTWAVRFKSKYHKKKVRAYMPV